MNNKSRRAPTPESKSVKKRKKPGQVFLIRALVIMIVAGSVFYITAQRFLPNFETGSVYDYIPNLNAESINVMIGSEVLPLEHDPLFIDEQLCLPVDFLKDYFDPYIFWEPDANRLAFTTERTVVVTEIGNPDCLVNNRQSRLSSAARREGNMAYVPESLIADLRAIDAGYESIYNIDIRFDESYNILIIDRMGEETTAAVLKKDAVMRFVPNIKSPVAQKLQDGEEIMVLGREESFVKARLSSGLIGYVPAKAVGEETAKPPVIKPAPESPPQIRPSEGKIVLLWDQVFDAGSSASPERQSAVPGVDVLSPTWFSFDADRLAETGEVGDIVSIGNAAYVTAAHANGHSVWPLITDNFNSKVSHAVLTDPASRDSVIRQLLAYADMYNADGINIDFEAVLEADADYFIQFLREFGPLLKERGIALSVDMFVPLYTKYYNRTEVAKVVDYICVMTYDEHYSGSPTTGPVASLGFVEDGLTATLDEVPKEKILMGLPFYVRVWTEKDEDGSISFYKQDTTMQNAYNMFTQKGAGFTWLPDIGCYYAEFNTTENGAPVTKKVWLEDESSIAEKLKDARDYDLAGVACWKRNLEKPAVWDDISDYKLQ